MYFVISYNFKYTRKHIAVKFIKNLHKIWHSQYLSLDLKIFKIKYKNSELII